MDIMHLKLLNVIALFCLWFALLWLYWRRGHAITREAQKQFFAPLLAGLTLWCPERVSDMLADFAGSRQLPRMFLVLSCLSKRTYVWVPLAALPAWSTQKGRPAGYRRQ